MVYKRASVLKSNLKENFFVLHSGPLFVFLFNIHVSYDDIVILNDLQVVLCLLLSPLAALLDYCHASGSVTL